MKSNESQIKAAQYVPNPDWIKEQLCGFEFYAQFDFTNGYAHLVLDEETRDRLAVWTPLGLLRPIVMPFGVMNATTYFQREMEGHFLTHSGYGKSLFVFIDDEYLGGHTWEGFLKSLREAFVIVRKAGSP